MDGIIIHFQLNLKKGFKINMRLKIKQDLMKGKPQRLKPRRLKSVFLQNLKIKQKKEKHSST